MISELRTVEEICQRADGLIAEGRNGDALAVFRDFVGYVISHESSIARVFTCKHFDQICQRIGQTGFSKTDAGDEFDGTHTVFLCTFLAGAGGHTRVLKELMQADRADRFTIVLTNVWNSATPETIKALFPGPEVEVEISPEVDLFERVLWVQQVLKRLRPKRTYILQHHYDSVVAAAAQPGLTETLVYFHNCDHSLALGAHIPHAVHVDFNAKGFHNCRDHEGIYNNVHWPLTAAYPRADAIPTTDVQFNTCSSGGLEKFDSSHLIEKIPYSIRYVDCVGDIILASGGCHIHIGQLPHQMTDEILESLLKKGIPSARFINLPWVSSLPEAFVENGVDVYVGSFPWGGGRASVEAMSVGLPMIVHSNYRSAFLTDQNEIYSEAINWRSKDDLVKALLVLKSPIERRRHSDASRAFFAANYGQEQLQAAMDRTFAGVALDEPPRSVYHTDALQTFLDEQASLRSNWNEQGSIHASGFQDQIRQLEKGLALAEKLAFERAAHIELLDRALGDAQKIAFERLAELERRSAQLSK